MKVNIKKVMMQFELEYNIKPPSITHMAASVGVNRVSMSRIINNPDSNITIRTLERVLAYLYDFYKPNFTDKAPKAFFEALQKSLIEYEIKLEFKL